MTSSEGSNVTTATAKSMSSSSSSSLVDIIGQQDKDQQQQQQREEEQHQDQQQQEQEQQRLQTRFSFYDAQEVQLQYGTTSFSSLLMPSSSAAANNNMMTTGSSSNRNGEEEEEENNNANNSNNQGRYNLYDPSVTVRTNTNATPTSMMDNVDDDSAMETTKTSSSKDRTKKSTKKTKKKSSLLLTRQQQQQQQEQPQTLKPQHQLHHHQQQGPILSLHREELAPVDSNASHQKQQQQQHDTDEILKSLLETEEQRMQILKTPVSGPAGPGGGGISRGMNNSSHHRIGGLGGGGGGSGPSTFDPAAPSTTTAAATTVGAGSSDFPVGGNTTDSNNNNSSTGSSNNPYEDAIREALDLLRKHRSPPPSPYATSTLAATAAGGEEASSGGIYHDHHQTNAQSQQVGESGHLPVMSVVDLERSRMSVATSAASAPATTRLSPHSSDRTPKNYDRLLQNRRDNDDHHQRLHDVELLLGSDGVVNDSYEGFHDAYQGDVDHEAENLLASVGSQEENLSDALHEVKLKTKQRQERMAEYASRLQEFKSSLPPDQQQHQPPPPPPPLRMPNSNTDSSKNIALNSLDDVHHQQQEPFESPSSPQHPDSTGSMGIPVPPQSSSRTTGSAGMLLASSTIPTAVVQPPPSIRPVPSMNDTDSVGLISELSHSTRPPPPPSYYYHPHGGIHPEYQDLQHQQQVKVEEEVQRGVEKVLLAILEASKSKGGDSSIISTGPGGGTGVETSSTHSSAGNVSEALLKVMDEVLHPTHNRTRSMVGGGSYRHHSGDAVDSRSQLSGGCSGGDHEQRGGGGGWSSSRTYVSSKSQGSHRSKRSGGERSVVEELLAEADDDHDVVMMPTESTAWDTSRQDHSLARGPTQVERYEQPPEHWQRDEKKMTDERGNMHISESTRGTRTAPALTVGTTDHKDIDAMIEESLRGSQTREDIKDDDEDDGASSDGEDEEDSDDGDRNSEFDGDESYEDDDIDDEEEEDARKDGRVLGPLSRNAGGTTGVVLDSASATTDEYLGGKSKTGYFSSVVSYVASALTPDQQRLLEDHERQTEIQGKDSLESMSTQDMEAKELMRTLCAHLLPYGVDQMSNKEDFIPAWDEDNANEAGYRIVRLSKSQLRRVERAFDTMITGLKHNSQSQLTVGEREYDANFVRELQVAERLLDDEEKRNLTVMSTNQSGKVSAPPKPATFRPNHDDEHDIRDVECVNISHPDFPGVKTAGQGEMGDLEYFQLPIIFKSHVTGFEPTKDMVLEPGNVVAGQYLVESELGSAAFSTAYRCIDLSSDDIDGHEEVCLKVIKNTKDFFDQSLDEIKILELLRQTGKCDENYIIRMKTFFYYREHLIIVTELLRQNLFEFGKFILDNNEEPYFTLPRLAYITRQCLMALRFVHSIGLVHSDVKPENILLGSYSRAQIKLIDFGSSCYLTDRQSSYIQSRSYRAPEVVLGLPYDGKIDVWSLGCVVAEMFTGEVTFQNDSIVSMLSRIEAICGSFPRHMIAQGRQSGRFFTKSGLLYEVVDDDSDQDGQRNPPGPGDADSDSETDSVVQFDVFQPKCTRLSSRLGFDADLMDGYSEEAYSQVRARADHQIKQMFTDFVGRLLTIDPDGRPTADEALQHPWMQYAASLTEDQIKYPSS